MISAGRMKRTAFTSMNRMKPVRCLGAYAVAPDREAFRASAAAGCPPGAAQGMGLRVIMPFKPQRPRPPRVGSTRDRPPAGALALNRLQPREGFRPRLPLFVNPLDGLPAGQPEQAAKRG